MLPKRSLSGLFHISVLAVRESFQLCACLSLNMDFFMHYDQTDFFNAVYVC